jgi:diguanylate cyclase (GGDEF)-like protein/PAS domain S-box-containing protein
MTSTPLATTSDSDFRLAAESTSQIMWIAASDGATEFLNPAGAMYNGALAAAHPKWDWASLVHPDEADAARVAWADATRTRSSYRHDHRLRRVDGEYRWHSVCCSPITDGNGDARWVGTAWDIDDAKSLEASLRLGERQSAATLKLLEMLHSKAPIGFGFIDREFRIVHLNEPFAAANGSTVAEQRGRLVADVVPQLWPRLRELYHRVLEHGEAILNVELEVPALGAAEEVRTYLASQYPVNVDDELIGIGVVVVDITSRKHAEQAMRFQAELLAAVGQAVVAVDLERTIIYWNRAAEQLYGWSAAEAIGRRSVDVIRREEAEGGPEMMVGLMRRGQTWSGEYEATGRDGSAISVHVTNTPAFGPDGSLVAVIGSSVDITERKAGDDARRRLSSIVDGSGDAIFGSTVDGFFTSWNPAAEQLFGYTAAEVIGRSVALIAPPGRGGEQSSMRDRLIAGGAHEHLETARLRKDGSLVDVLITASTMTDDTGAVVGLAVIARDITARLEVERTLESSLRRLAEAQAIAQLGSFDLDVVTEELNWSDESFRIFGLDPGIALTRELLMATIHRDDRPKVAAAEIEVEKGLSIDLDFRIIRDDFEVRWLRAHAVPEVDADGTIVRVAGTIMDDTDRVEADRVRTAAETRFETGFEQSAIGTAITDLNGIPRRVNAAMCTILGRPAELVVGHRWAEYGHPDEVALAHMMLTRLAAGHETHHDERRYLRPDGTIVWVLSHVTLVRDEEKQPQYFFAQFQDISERKQMEHDLAHQALHDSLTGLPNRVLLSDRLLHGLAGSRRRASQLGVIFLDVDQFKVVNDSMGHSAGDEFLRLAAGRISGAIRPGDTVARFGGDEFVVVCDDVSAFQTEQIAARVLEVLRQPCNIGNESLRITASLGIAIADDHATPESLLRDADAAMYRAKERGGDRAELFDDTLRFIAKRRLATAAALHRALERHEFKVQYQPVVDLLSGEMVSVEALLRWQHPEHGLIVPADFITVAEDTGQIVPIGAMVLEQACLDLAAWQRVASTHPPSSLSVAVNLSVRQMRSPQIVHLIENVLQRTKVRPADLCLELTESVFMEDVDYFEATLSGLKQLGLDLAIDDFGTGYSSLSRLKRFPFDAVKIDRAFVDGLGTDPHDTALVAAIVAMASALGLQVTAEGVETKEQLSCLKELGVCRAQGFYLAKPMPAASISRLIGESHRWTVD